MGGGAPPKETLITTLSKPFAPLESNVVRLTLTFAYSFDKPWDILFFKLILPISKQQKENI
jgi:hypothetical protein